MVEPFDRVLERAHLLAFGLKRVQGSRRDVYGIRSGIGYAQAVSERCPAYQARQLVGAVGFTATARFGYTGRPCRESVVTTRNFFRRMPRRLSSRIIRQTSSSSAVQTGLLNSDVRRRRPKFTARVSLIWANRVEALYPI
jgi:hypothetical protein